MPRLHSFMAVAADLPKLGANAATHRAAVVEAVEAARLQLD